MVVGVVNVHKVGVTQSRSAKYKTADMHWLFIRKRKKQTYIRQVYVRVYVCRSVLSEQKAKVLYDPMPVIWLKPGESPNTDTSFLYINNKGINFIMTLELM